MRLNRHFYSSSSLDGLETLEKQLEQAGVDRLRIHVLSLDDTAVENHKGLHEVESLMKTDLIRSALSGLLLGAVLAALFLFLTILFDWPASTGFGWVPFGFATAIILGIVAWEGGLLGIQRHNQHFRKFEKMLNEGQHLLFVDIEPDRESTLSEIAGEHADISKVGKAKSAPRWVLLGEQKVTHFLRETMP